MWYLNFTIRTAGHKTCLYTIKSRHKQGFVWKLFDWKKKQPKRRKTKWKFIALHHSDNDTCRCREQTWESTKAQRTFLVKHQLPTQTRPIYVTLSLQINPNDSDLHRSINQIGNLRYPDSQWQKFSDNDCDSISRIQRLYNIRLVPSLNINCSINGDINSVYKWAKN